MKPKNKIHKLTRFDDIVEESKMCPGGLDDEYDIVMKSPMDQYFLDVADKHGVIDEMFSERAEVEDIYNDEMF